MITVALHAPNLPDVLSVALGLMTGFALCLMYWLCHYSLSGCEACGQRLTQRDARARARYVWAQFTYRCRLTRWYVTRRRS